MLKKIPVAELALGMYIHKICRRWTNDPFWIGLVEVMLDDIEVLRRIQQSGTQEVWIETGKSRVLAPGPSAASTAPSASDDTTPTSLEKEVLRARVICGRARDAVMSMFTEARMGQAMDVGNVQLLVEEISNSILRHPHALISLS
ncbi:DUF3391 domain-containing protein, partial [Pseudomonas syringae]